MAIAASPRQSFCKAFRTVPGMGRVKQHQKPPTTIGRNLLRLRTAAGLSQDELAAKAGIARPTLGNIETGATSPASATVELLARALQVKVSELTEDPQAFHPIATAIEAFLADAWGTVTKPTPEEIEWLRGLPGQAWFGFGPSGPSPKALHHLLEARRAQQSTDSTTATR